MAEPLPVPDVPPLCSAEWRSVPNVDMNFLYHDENTNIQGLLAAHFLIRTLIFQALIRLKARSYGEVIVN